MTAQTRILIVDDDFAIRLTLTDVLEALGFAVAAAGTGTEAVKMAKAQVFDVAIVDLKLPDTNGLDVIKAIKQINENINCIIMTAYSKELPSDVVLNGSGGYFAKPINLDKMVGAIKKLAN